MKYVFMIVSFLLLGSCSNHVEELQSENEVLKAQNDSLIEEVKKYVLRPYIDNVDFDITTNDTFKTKALMVLKDGVVVDSAIVKGFSKKESEDMIELVESDNGTVIKFSSDKLGDYEVKAYSRVHVWDEKVVPLIFPVKVKKANE